MTTQRAVFLNGKKCKINIRKKFFIMRVMSHWNRLSREKNKRLFGKKNIIVFSSNRIDREFLLP